MIPFRVKAEKIMSRGDTEALKKGRKYFNIISRRTKREAHVRSAYFKKQKIFFTYFWNHLYQKPPRQRRMRIRLLPCAIELIEKSKNIPTTKTNPAKKTELLHRFYGITKDKEVFYVQIKENTRTKRKELMSIVLP